MKLSKKLFMLLSSVIGGLETIAVALVTYFAPPMATAINTCIVLVGTCIIECLSNFVIDSTQPTKQLG
jgi:uncharacterized membrane protein YwzB